MGNRREIYRSLGLWRAGVVDHLCQSGSLTGFGFANRSLDGLGEDLPDTGCVFAQYVGVDAQGYGGVGVAEAGGHDVDGDSGEKQRGRVQVAQLAAGGAC